MCLKGQSSTMDSCSGCQECVAVETLLSIGQSPRSPSSSCSSSTASSPRAFHSQNYTTLLPGRHTPVWHPVPTMTPPPSEAGSMSPPQSEDSCDMFDSPTPLPPPPAPPKKTSRLAQVSRLFYGDLWGLKKKELMKDMFYTFLHP